MWHLSWLLCMPWPDAGCWVSCPRCVHIPCSLSCLVLLLSNDQRRSMIKLHKRPRTGRVALRGAELSPGAVQQYAMLLQALTTAQPAASGWHWVCGERHAWESCG